MKQHFDSERIMKQLLDSIIRYKSKWAAAGMALVLGAGSIGVSFLYHPARKATVPEPEVKETTEAAVIEAPTEAETESVWIPTLDELNLAHYFPESEEDTDITKSLAGHVFHELMTRDANWSSALYAIRMSHLRIWQAKLGISRERILGKYNPEDESHQKENPSTWTIGNFRNVKIQAVDGDGHSVSPYSNVPQIMSMANVYTYYHNPQDSDSFLFYAKALWEASHSIPCLPVMCTTVPAVSERRRRSWKRRHCLRKLRLKKKTQSGTPYEEISEDAKAIASQSEESSAENQTSVITAGLATAEKKAKEESQAESSAAEAKRRKPFRNLPAV